VDSKKAILLTGAAGFIGSYLLGYLNKQGYRNIIIADDFSDEDKWFNFDSKDFSEKVERDELMDWLYAGDREIGFVYHLGARTDTTEFDYSVLEKLNLDYSKQIWKYCAANSIPLIYASSAATYGGGEFGYKDDHELVLRLQPLNPYGISKNEFDKWALRQDPTVTGACPPKWAGLKFFNVYGPNEYHKGRMASVIFHAFNQIKATGKVKLFRSHRPDFEDGKQLRDFIYVEDVAKVCYWLLNHQVNPGLYNLGTGEARTFEDLAKATFSAMGKKAEIDFIDIPEDIREKYQYFTEADMKKLRTAGFTDDFHSLEDGVKDYVTGYLLPRKFY
jgi:ADP-L-glycero-D-manno-heptose 6-epimerase